MAKTSAGAVPGVGRPRFRRAYWQARIEECRRSGLSQAAFCRRRGIVPGTFAFWKHTLACEARDASAVRVHGPAGLPAFVPVRVVAHPQASDAGGASPAGAGEIVIVLAGARRVRVRGRVDAQWLGEVLRTVAALGC